MDKPRLTITRIPNLNVLVIRQKHGTNFFISTQDSIVIDVPGLTYIIKFLVMNGILNPKLLEGILEEYDDSRK